MKSVLAKIAEEVDANKKIAMAIVTKLAKFSPGAPGATMGVYEDGGIIGTVGGGSLEAKVIEKALVCLKEGVSKSFEFEASSSEIDGDLHNTSQGKTEVFIRVFNEKPKLLLVGGGHVSHELYKFGKYMGFSVGIFEDREAFCNKERFPDADELILGDVVESLRNYKVDNNCYVIMVSRGHIYDENALKEVISSDAKYIGMIGSKLKVENIFNNLRKDGVSDDLLNKVYSPIGIAIGGKEIKEIVLGIMAEVVLVKNGGTAGHMKSISNLI
ncbi:XdhC family protein [Clostridium cylindrosporum]|uniref:Xanthine and CO dehydrogenase maturation factor, XdhC/CoxF family n=1 Tax=Clostridium cylindrosporum DSM 605 TaxID=1121307 RepID=A0A0J8DCV1_CLOCY|nr:XdhC/CoxI family protein [Clostridium cylindrosporum]KMT22078.1 xanthine and CO dehydrogenase maturation factor, XdhC/CoxF family [Clostridium cylindrosporum DSM 605]